jgi:hypothetical protein
MNEDNEYNDIRENLKDLIKKGQEAIDEVNKLSKDGDTMENYPDNMFEEAEKREKLNAGFKQDGNGNWYRPTLQELTRNERIDLAEKEIAYLVMGGQDGREYANSITFIMDVLNSLRDKEDTEWKDSAEGVA